MLFAQLGNKYNADGANDRRFNTDDPVGREFEQSPLPVLTYGPNTDAMIRAQNIQIYSHGTEFDLSVFGHLTHVTRN